MEEEDNGLVKAPQEKDTRFNLNRKIFVGNISYRIEHRKLKDFFKKFGDVEYCYIVKDHLKKWSRGIAFVTFCDEEGMKKALQATDDQLLLDNRLMRVKPAEISHRATYWCTNNGDPTNADEYVKTDDKICENNEDCKSQADVRYEEREWNQCPPVHPDSPTHINNMCDEVLVKIFSSLTVKERLRNEQVCHRWKEVLATKSWTDVDSLHFRNVFQRFAGLTDKMLNSILLRCGQYLRRLDLSASPRLLTDFAIDIIGKYCPNLRELDLSGVKVTDISMRKLGDNFKSLKSIHVRSCLYLGEKGLQDLFSSCLSLEHIDLQGNSRLKGKCLQMLNENVKFVQLNGCTLFADVGIKKLTEVCPDIEELHFEQCRKITGRGFLLLCQKFLKLKVLEFSGVMQHVEGTMNLENLSELVELNVSNNMCIDDKVVRAVVEGCPKLEGLDISLCHRGVTDFGVMSLGRCCHLHTLNISYLPDVDSSSLASLAYNGKLRKLVARACRGMSDHGMEVLAEFCPLLEHVDLSGCFQITNATLQAFYSRVADKEDRTLHLHLGGTSVILDTVDWLPKCSSIQVFTFDLSSYHLRADKDIILPSEEDYEDEEEQKSEKSCDIVGVAGGAELEESEEDYDFQIAFCDEDNDEFLNGDDPLAAERWELS